MWQQDLADGCWNGRAGAAADAPRLFYGGTQALGDDPTRRGLADAIAGYLRSARNATPFTVVDVLPLLDAIATGGGASAAGLCGAGPGQPGTLVPPTDATGFDQVPPIVTVTPAEGAVVRGTVLVSATATDNLDVRPTLVITAPAALAGQDLDGDPTDADVRATLDTVAAVGGEGPITIRFESEDDAGQLGTAARTLVVDNVAPQLAIAGVDEGESVPPPRVLTYTASDSHLAGVSALLDGAPFASGAAVTAAGVHTLALAASDTAGNQATATRTFRIDGAAPVITITGVTDGAFYPPPVTVGVTADDVDLANVLSLVDGAPFAGSTIVDAEGHHAVDVTASDHAGNTAEAHLGFTIDGTAPDVTIAGIAAQGVYAPPRTITFDATDAHLATVTATLDGQPFASGAAVAAEGDHTLVVTARDRAGNQTIVSRAFTIDGAPPLVTVGGVAEQGFHAPPVTITFAALDPHLVSATATLDGMPLATGTSVSAEGAHDLDVVAVDAAGNRTEVTRHFTLDGTRPTVSIVPALQDGGFYPRQAHVRFAAMDANLLSVSATLDGAPFADNGAIDTDGPHTLVVGAVDKAGNNASLSRAFTIDGTPPTVTFAGVDAGGFYRPGVRPTFSVVDTNLATVTATLDGAPFASGDPVVGADGLRTLAVTALDRAGNTTSASIAFTIDGTPPVVAIVPDLAAGGFYPRQAHVRFTGTDANLVSTTATLDGAPFADNGAIDADGSHTLAVTAVDKAGNDASLSRTFTIDGTPPTVSFGVVEDAHFYQPGVRPTFAAADSNLASTTATLDGAPFASGDPVVGADGLRTLAVTAVDRAGNTTSASIAFTIDGTAPAVTVGGIVDGGAYRSPRQVDYGATDVNLSSVAATLTTSDGQTRPFASGASALAADAGACTLRVTAADRAGNQTVRAVSFVIDDAAPVIAIGNVAEGGYYQAAAPTFGATDATLATVAATLDGAPFVSGTDVAAEGPHTLVVTAADRAGNGSTATVHFTVDRTPPVLALGPSGLISQGGVLWTVVPSPDLAVDATDANLLDVRALQAGAVIATDADGAAPWHLVIPAPLIPAANDVTIDLVARDRAGNTTTISPRFRYDAAPPVVSMQPTTVLSERGDIVTFTASIDPQDYRVNHAHAGAAVTLGPATACATGGASPAPRVSKYAYLLDASMPPYVTETNPANPFTWKFVTSDDGIGLDPSTVAYRVRDVAADQIVLDWTPLSTQIPGSYSVTLHRNGGAQPSIALLGSKAGLFELQVRSRDLAGREQVVTRCWDHDPLAAPLKIDAAGVATAGPSGSGKYALADLHLEDTTTPIDPVGAQVLSDPAGSPFGTGLMQFPVYNATTEPVYLTIDLTRPAATYSKVTVLNRRTIDTDAGTADCGPATDEFGDPLPPDTTLPYCIVGVPAAQAGTTTPLESDSTNPAYGVRVWEQVSAASFVELTANCPAPGCNQTSPPGKVRLTVRLPPRPVSPFGDPLPARKFWVMPVVQSITALRPDATGPWSEFLAGGVTVTGDAIAPTLKRCSLALSSTTGHWRCTAKRTVTTFNALKSATFVLDEITSVASVSLDGTSLGAPPYMASPTLRLANYPDWSTTEPSGL
ncbi:MAG TPA: Ig-like domain-containing protein [Kofleriaceae bacterium]|nr:Ig-like domain-containing protein [Kofleriaceae bacterium]